MLLPVGKCLLSTITCHHGALWQEPYSCLPRPYIYRYKVRVHLNSWSEIENSLAFDQASARLYWSSSKLAYRYTTRTPNPALWRQLSQISWEKRPQNLGWTSPHLFNLYLLLYVATFAINITILYADSCSTTRDESIFLQYWYHERTQLVHH